MTGLSFYLTPIHAEALSLLKPQLERFAKFLLSDSTENNDINTPNTGCDRWMIVDGERERMETVELLDSGRASVVVASTNAPSLISTAHNLPLSQAPRDRLRLLLSLPKIGSDSPLDWEKIKSRFGGVVISMPPQFNLTDIESLQNLMVEIQAYFTNDNIKQFTIDLMVPYNKILELKSQLTLFNSVNSIVVSLQTKDIDQVSSTEEIIENLAGLFCDLLANDRSDGLIPTVVVNERQTALGLVYSSRLSIIQSIRNGRGIYYSRSRQNLWEKGATSGAVQILHRIDFDCDRDALKFTVTQMGSDTSGCWGPLKGTEAMMETLKSRLLKPVEDSYTNKLFSNPEMLNGKIREEAQELCDAETKAEITWEAADLIYFTLAKCVANGVDLADVERQLDQRSLKIKRRPGLVKPNFMAQPPGFQAKTAESFQLPVYEKIETREQREHLLKRPIMEISKILEIVRPIIEDVKTRGDDALSEYTRRFDRASLKSPIIFPPYPADLLNQVSPATRSAIDLAFSNIEKFHKAQLDTDSTERMPRTLTVETMPGVECFRFYRPIERVGLYVPGGSAVLPSTAMMLGIPAKVAGCPRVIFATPPRPDGTPCPELVYIADKIRAECILLAGGAQAVAALAYGTQSCPKVDKICGPGNQFVTAAKMLVQNDPSCLVGIDMPAGPSEVLVIADSSCNPVFVASDLLSQAEHGPDSQVVLLAVNFDQSLMDAVQREVKQQALKLPRRDIIEQSLRKSFLLQCESLEDSIQFSNEYAPEHLILHVTGPRSLLPKITNAGSVFLGPYSPESCGDYASGTNHTLPTYGYAKMYSGVNTLTFMKSITAQELTATGLQSIGPAVEHLAAIEGLDGHRNAVTVRLRELAQSKGN